MQILRNCGIDCLHEKLWILSNFSKKLFPGQFVVEVANVSHLLHVLYSVAKYSLNPNEAINAMLRGVHFPFRNMKSIKAAIMQLANH